MKTKEIFNKLSELKTEYDQLETGIQDLRKVRSALPNSVATTIGKKKPEEIESRFRTSKIYNIENRFKKILFDENFSNTNGLWGKAMRDIKNISFEDNIIKVTTNIYTLNCELLVFEKGD